MPHSAKVPILPAPPSLPVAPPPHGDLLLAQEAAEDARLQRRRREMWTAEQEHSCPADNETTPWLKHTRWPAIFRNRPLDIITATAQKPARRQEPPCDFLLGHWRGRPLLSPAQDEAALRRLMDAADQMFARAGATLERTSYRWRCWLNTYDKDDSRFHPTAFRALPSQGRYITAWKQFLCYAFRVFACPLSVRRHIYNVAFQPREEQIMRDILVLLQEMSMMESKEKVESKDNDEDGEEDDRDWSDDEGEEDESSWGDDGEEDVEDAGGHDAVNTGKWEGDSDFGKESTQSCFCLPSGRSLRLAEALFQLSITFWSYQDPSGDMASSTLIHFTAVMGIHRHSLAYKTAYLSTPGHAALIWIGRLLFLEYALPLLPYTTLAVPWPARESYPCQLDRLQGIRAEFLLRGTQGPFAEILELKAYAKSIIKQEGCPTNLTWAPDGRSLTISDNQPVSLVDFCAVHRRASAQVKELVDNMMLGWEPVVNLNAIYDDLTCRTPGWSFLDHPANNLSSTFKALSRQAWTASFSGMQFAKSGHWRPDSCAAYLDAGTELANKIFAAVHLTAGMPGRGTEVCSIRLCNTQLTLRHVFVREGRILIIFSYNKARTMNNYAFYIVRYLPTDLALSVFKYIVFVRPFLNFLASQLNTPRFYSTEYFFADPNHKKSHLSSTQASGILKKLTCGLASPWNLSLYRQIATAIAKRHISKLVKANNFYHPSNASDPVKMIAAGVGHHPRTLLNSYAIDKALPSRLQPELLEMYLRLSTLWQTWNSQYYEEDHLMVLPTTDQPLQPPPSPLSSQRFRTLKRLGTPPTSEMSSKRRISDSDTLVRAPSTPETTSDGYIYNSEYRILICIACEAIVQPEPKSWYRHLNSIHRITGVLCKTLLNRFETYDLCPVKELFVPQERVISIRGLKIQSGFRCDVCSRLGNAFFTIHEPLMLHHISLHKLGISPRKAWDAENYVSCLVQTFSLSKGRICYFEVTSSQI